MCDTLCVTGGGRTLFAKSSDRPLAEPQVLEVLPPRTAGGTLRTTYLDIPDTGAYAVLGSRPAWMWGLEHGINEHRVAIGNEKIWTVDDPHADPPALLGMDLVRLGLERGRDADRALDAIVALLERHGQGGSGEQDADEPYWSSFLVADPTGAWVLETSGRRWAAKRVDDGAAISNRITLGSDWTRASTDVEPGSDVDTWRDPTVPTAIGDLRLAATRACVATGAVALSPRELVATMRHHGERSWGAPGDDPADLSPVPTGLAADFTGISVCMHLRDYQATTASIVAELPADPDRATRAWAALGSPCASVYLPVFPPQVAPPALASASTWQRFAALRERVDAEPGALGSVRAVLAPVEAQLWERADALDPADEPVARAFVDDAWRAVDAALRALGV